MRCSRTVITATLFAGLVAACGGGSSAPASPGAPSAPAAPPAPPQAEVTCSAAYGSAADRSAIELAMANGSAADVSAAIAAARTTRGQSLGCPESISTRSPLMVRRDSVDEVRARWNSLHAPALASFRIQCPEIGRGSPSAALGGYAALRANAVVSATALTQIARMVEAQQYSVARAGAVPDTVDGVFGGYVSGTAGDACAPGGVPGQFISEWCRRYANQCVTYNEGLFAGRRFVVADVNRATGVFDGGIGFDQGWSGVMMIEAAQAESDPALRALFRSSALRAGQWAAVEPPVRNHNYTAKNVWLLARLYGWTGEARWREALLDKLERNLLPGVLMDADGDGRTDAPGPAVPFAQLAVTARVPGRMWDGHNAVTHYLGMNTVGVLEAYVALRDRGDAAAAQRVRPYALAMLDNLAREFTELGMPDGTASPREAGLALLLAVWKIARPEQLVRPDWERVVDAVWGSDALRSAGAGTSFAGLYLAMRAGVDYRDRAP